MSLQCTVNMKHLGYINVLFSLPMSSSEATTSTTAAFIVAKSTTCHWTNIFELVQHSKHPLQWRHNGRDSLSNHQPHECLLNGLFRHRWKKTWKLRVTGLCAGNSPGNGEFPAQTASNVEYVSIWWRHHDPRIELSRIPEIHLTHWPLGDFTTVSN